MASIADIRAKYPQYKNLSDQQLGDALYSKFYAGKITRDQFNEKLGIAPAGNQAVAPVPQNTAPPPPAQPQSGNPLDGVMGAIGGGLNTIGQMGQNIYNIPGALAAQGQQIASDPGSIPDRFNSFASGMMDSIPIAGPFITGGMNNLKSQVQTAMGNPETPEQRAAYEQANRAKFPTEATEGGVVGTTAPFAVGGATALGSKLLGLEGPALSRVLYGAGSQYGISAGDSYMRGRSPGQALGDAIIPAVAGGALSGLFGGRLSKDAVTNDAASTLSKAGVPLTTAQRTGSLLGGQVENRGFGAAKMAGKQDEAFTAAHLNTAGINAPRATPEVMANAYKDFNKEFRSQGSSTSIPYDTTLQQRLNDVVDSHKDNSMMPAPVVEKMKNGIEKVAANNGGVISGDAYQTIRSQIGDKLDHTTNPDTIGALGRLQDALDDGVARNMGPKELAAWQQLRRRYKNFVVARNALPAGSAEAAKGIITPKALAGAVKQTEGQLGWTIGRGDSNELAHAGMAINPIEPAGIGGHIIPGMVGAGLMGAGGALGFHLGLGPELGAIAAGAALPGLTGGAMLAGRGLSGVPQAALARALMGAPTGAQK